ncbi:MAG: GNAT family N-acetyltransferase [Hyphomicrobiales bacterium]
MNVVIARADPPEPQLRRLIEELDALQLSLYPAESNHLLDIETLVQPQMRFFAAAVDGRIVGCGGVWLHEDYAEVKRVYVSPKTRGLGLAKKIMARLEDEARAAGMSIARLETGIYQPEALGLYRALGYADRGPFGDYPADDPMSVFMEKRL